MKGHFLSFFLSFHFGDVVSNGVLVAFCIVFLISLLDGSTGGPPVAPPGALPSFFLLPGFFFVGGEGGGSLLLRRSFRKAVEVGAGGYRVFLPSFLFPSKPSGDRDECGGLCPSRLVVSLFIYLFI